MPNRIRYIAIDDNPIDLMILQEFSKEFPLFQFLGGFKNANEGLESVKEINPDLVFLDIEMPGKMELKF
jgi:two-component system LytT family response regulator